MCKLNMFPGNTSENLTSVLLASPTLNLTITDLLKVDLVCSRGK